MKALAAALVLVAIPAPTPAAPAPNDRIYVIERIGERIAPDAIVGVKRAGLACLPNGRIAWSDVALGGPADRREYVEDRLEDAGLPIATLAGGAPLHRQIRLRGIITDASFNMCAKNMLGRPSALSGTARLSIEWRGEDLSGRDAPLHHVTTVDHRFEGAKAAPLGEIGRVLLEEATRDLATWLQSAPGE